MADALIQFFSDLPREIYVFVISMLPIVELRGAIPVGTAIGLPFYTNYILSVIGNILPVPFILFFISGFLDQLARFKTFRPIVEWIRKKADKHSSRVIKNDKPEGEVAKQITEDDKGVATLAPESADFSVINTDYDYTEEKASSAQVAETADSEAISAPESVAKAALTGTETIAEDSAKSMSAVAEESSADTEEQKEGGATYQPRRMTATIFTALMLFVAIPLPGTGAWTGSLVAALFCLPKRLSMLSIALGVLISGVIMCLASYGVLGFLSFLI